MSTITVTRRNRFTVRLFEITSGAEVLRHEDTRMSAAAALGVAHAHSDTMRSTGWRMEVSVRGVVVSSCLGGMGPSIDPMVRADMQRLADEGGSEIFAVCG